MCCLVVSCLWAVRLALGVPLEPLQAGYLCRRVACAEGIIIQTERYCPQEGDILIFTYKNPLWRCLYALAGSGPPYHAGIVVRMPNGELATLEAGPTGTYNTYLLPLPHRLPAYNGSIWVRRLKEPLTSAESERLTEFASDQTGKGFAFGRLLVAAVTPLRPRGPIRYDLLGTTCLDRQRWFCSELVMAAAVVAGRADPQFVHANGIYPRDLLLDEPYDFSATWEQPLLWTKDSKTLCGQPYPEYEALQ